MDTKYLDFSTSFKKKMILITTCTHPTSCFASYSVYHYGLNETLLKSSFSAEGISDNLTGFYATIEAIKCCHDRFVDAEIFSANSCSVGWIKNLKSNSKQLKQSGPFYEKLIDAQRFLQSYRGNIKVRLWANKWGSIHDVINGAAFEVNREDIPYEEGFNYERLDW